MMVVQVFFFLSSFMLTYLLQVQARKNNIGWSVIPKNVVTRWFRLTPVYAVMLALTVSWARHLSSRPLWNLSMTLGSCAQCRKYWWSHLLYVNNMIPENKICLIQTWFLCHFSSNHFRYVHIRAYINLPWFLLGMATGYMGHSLQTRGMDLSKSMALRFLSWWFIPLFIWVIYLGHLFYTTDLRESVLAQMVYAVTHRAALGVLCSAWVLGLICHCNDASRTLFSWRGWMVTSKLSYCVVIVHFTFIQIYIGHRRELSEGTLADMIPMTVAMLVVSYIIAVPMYLMIEVPFKKINNGMWTSRQFKENKNL